MIVKKEEIVYIDEATREETVRLEYTEEGTFKTSEVVFKKEHYDIAMEIFKYYSSFEHLLVASDKKSLCFGIDFSDNKIDRELGTNLYKVTIEKAY